MEETETELTCSEQDALGADFITVELDTQPIEYVVKWAEVGSKFTITCVKKDLDEDACFTANQMVKVEPDETFYVPYDTVYPECDEAAPDLIATHEEEVGSESDFTYNTEAGNSQFRDEEDLSDICWEREVSHARTYNCRFCGKSYSHSSSLARHLHVHSNRSSLTSSKDFSKLCGNKKSLQCNLCGVRCNGKRLMAIHKKCHKTKRLHTCNTCGKTFNHSSSLSRHRLIHKKGLDENVRRLYPTPTPAPIMTQHNFPSSHGTSKRTASLSSGEREKQYQCTQCDRVFSHSAGLSKHQVAHVRQLLNSYTHGKASLDKSSDLKIRLKLCSSDKPNYYTLCKKNKHGKGGKKRLCLPNDERMCEKRFSHTARLSSDKCYTCNVCKKTFIRLSNLKQHQQTHASGKLYECPQCGKTFVHSSSFSRHKKVHTMIKLSPKQENIKCEEELVIDEVAPLEYESE
ncbi:zinc finger protein 883-like [Sinocyclocheilus anshuiensis]|uniref:Zinc finger protein 883-like n=1 Tax=Sinocyclocheilus anshuiensis TaxID=1608454 RepID=A0A671K2G7_9TELE|nr:PREDICTED: zinc finger protein 883-like [Sinocyclocheilus anshuiensis]XP_016352170.1 PREDICTED: zinc finger protein 883-like [Sinocyclocheilus anshuiensis]XP_016352172.1 PREDICTED: zinc finger protein 883-like [Sinocyclocheilus anshuiensis]XP_016352173.1 PREDICTED: zinc finger protein 883-like [Sinocyclocheilus anshuiensis]XP_016352174.1 PREDICTED: zinc finger protein 883-like [Sinocyclocheilus anshuiensis]XP_016352175.1 PREDICTED: zinc finger protein 883-like [Sinocyclocheilus anshuiensis]